MRVVLFLLNLLSGCSWPVLYKLSDVFEFVLFRIVGYRKDTIDRNLKSSFPEKSPAEIAAIRARFYRHFADVMVETVKLSRGSKDEIAERVAMSEESRTLLRGIKKGAVVVMGHRGNWELANLFISSLGLVDPVAAYKPLANKVFEDWFRAMRTRFGTAMIPAKKLYEELERPRDKPFAVYLVNDQAPNPAKAYWTTFLNQDTGVFRGAEIISRKYDIPVIFGDIECVEGKRGQYVIDLRLFTDNPTALPQNAILESQIRGMEENIRRQPYNWLWTHKRWKHARPEELSDDQLLETPDGWKKAQQNS